MIRVLARLVADCAATALLLFLSGGTMRWPAAWVLILLLLVLRVATAILVHRVNPALIEERAALPVHAGQPAADRVLVWSVLATGFAALPVIAALEVFRWHLFSPPPIALRVVGLALFGLGWLLKGVVLRENAFATSVLRLQQDRRHIVIDTGLYSSVRHPFYAGTVCVLLGLALWLGSYLAVIAAIIPISLLGLRIRFEERFLVRELAGYDEYAHRVRYRLVPGVW